MTEQWPDLDSRVLVDPADVPGWLTPLVAAAQDMEAGELTRIPAPDDDIGRPASVLMLLGERDGPGSAPDVLLLRRADGLSSHPGQVSFPGGSLDLADAGPVEAAVREATEEVGLDPTGVRPVAIYPRLFLPPSQFLVTPVLAHWVRPSPVAPVDLGETAAVARVPLAYLADPANRIHVRHPSGYLGAGFLVPDMLVWGFTAGLLAVLLALGGWEQPWDEERIVDLDVAWRAARDLAEESDGVRVEQ